MATALLLLTFHHHVRPMVQLRRKQTQDRACSHSWPPETREKTHPILELAVREGAGRSAPAFQSQSKPSRAQLCPMSLLFEARGSIPNSVSLQHLANTNSFLSLSKPHHVPLFTSAGTNTPTANNTETLFFVIMLVLLLHLAEVSPRSQLSWAASHLPTETQKTSQTA